MSVRDEVNTLLDKMEEGGWQLDHVDMVDQVTSLPGPGQVMTLYVTLPVEFSFRQPENADV